MTTHNFLSLIVVVLSLAALGTRVRADDDVTVISTTGAATAPATKSVASDGTPVVHKSLHKKKYPATQTALGTSALPSATSLVGSPTSGTAASNQVKVAAADVVSSTHSQSVAGSDPAPSIVASSAHLPAASPTVETGLPVARYPGMGSPIRGVSTYSPLPVVLPPMKSMTGSTTHLPYFASALSPSVVNLTSSAAGSFSSPSRTTSPTDFVFQNYGRRTKNFYPWKTGIITTMFYIGEGDTPISHTTNVQSSWDEDWLSNNHGTDSPYNRNGYASGNHASTLNPFYVALPFNDLAFPDKARRWLPSGWYRRPEDGKQVSACKDRWVEIKNQRGDYCYAQWEDVGPLNYSDAEYVFGEERPNGLGDNHAGLDVSPAVAQYLGVDGKNRITSWRFVDDEDVRPGAWLKLDEQAVLYTALHQLKNRTPSDLPIQRATEPSDDPSNLDSNKKKVDASKG